MGALVNGIKASIFGGIPGALVGGLILDKFLGVKQFREYSSQYDIQSIYDIYGKVADVECGKPTWLGSDMITGIPFNFHKYGHEVSKTIMCKWELSSEWVLATFVLGITSVFWVYRYLTNK